VEPIHRYVTRSSTTTPPTATPNLYDKRSWEPIYVVDTTGDLYSYAETYEPGFCHGNLFSTPFKELIGSPRPPAPIELARAAPAASAMTAL
jgi:uncharacterized protein